MKALVGLVALLFATSAFAQSTPPKIGKKPLVQVKPQAPMGCKLIGTVKGTKIWAGECTDAAELRGAAPAAEVTPLPLPVPAAGAIPGEKP
jgi:hypothetical protein